MNTKAFRHLITLFTVAAALATATTSCTDSDMPAAPDTPAADPADLPGVIRFTLSDLNSRVSSSGLSGKFEPGDKIGCIISNRVVNKEWNGSAMVDVVYHNEYYMASCWEVDASGKFIVLKQIKKPYDNDTWRDIDSENNDFICRLNQLEEYSSSKDEYLYLKKSDINYAFLFYYPFVTNEGIESSLQANIAQYQADSSTPFCELVEYPSCAETDGLLYNSYGNHSKEKYDLLNQYSGSTSDFAFRKIFSAEISDNTQNTTPPNDNLFRPTSQWHRYSWKDYPVFVSTNQRGDKVYQQNDFMFAIRDLDNSGAPLNNGNQNSTLEVKFYKKHAAIEIEFDFEVSNVRLFYSDEDQKNALSGRHDFGGFIIGRKFDLSTDKFDWWYTDKSPDYNLYGNDRVGRYYLQRWPDDMYPHQIGENHYRIILPPQPVPDTDEAGFLVFDDGGEKEQQIPLRKLLPVPAIEENKLYIIRLRRADVWSLEIRDWADGEDNDLEEIKKEHNNENATV